MLSNLNDSKILQIGIIKKEIYEVWAFTIKIKINGTKKRCSFSHGLVNGRIIMRVAIDQRKKNNEMRDKISN